MLKRKTTKAQLGALEDEALISAYCSGNQLAFEVLYNRHRDPLYRFILRQCNNNISQCEEIFQDVWFNLIKNSHQFRADSKFSTYLYQMTRNKVIDYIRKASSHHEHAHDEYNDEHPAGSNQQPDEKTQLALCIELLQQFIQKLPSEQKEAFVLKQETGHSLEELAKITETTTETLKSRLRYAMKKLREWLPGECL